MGCKHVGEAAFPAVEGQDARDPVRSEVGPEFLFGEKEVGARGDADNADAGRARVSVQRTVQPRPLGVPDAAGEDVHPVPHPAQRQRNLLDVDQLPAEVRVLGPVPVLRIKVSLGVQKGQEHRGVLHLG